MDRPAARSIAENLAHRFGDNADPVQVADTVVSVWRAIDAALSPILGHMGVAALYKRSLQLSTPAHPWLSEPAPGPGSVFDVEALRSALSQQEGAAAAAAGGAHLQAFVDLLVTLLGPSLAERLLRPVWVNFPGGPSAQDTSP